MPRDSPDPEYAGAGPGPNSPATAMDWRGQPPGDEPAFPVSKSTSGKTNGWLNFPLMCSGLVSGINAHKTSVVKSNRKNYGQGNIMATKNNSVSF